MKMAGSGVLLQAARDGDLTLVKKRLKASIFKKGEDVNRRDDRECTALHYAAKTSNIAIASLLLAKGADLAAEDKHGWSVLHYAVRYGTEAMVQFLVERGANIHCKEKRGWGVLHLAARNGHSDKARLLLENGVSVSETQRQGWNSLHLAVRYGQPDTISTMLEYGININAENAGWTALHLAALNGHMDIVSILLNKGASTGIKNREGKTALDIAREEGHERIVAIILETEFQTESPELPSPPPTPPSAPPIEFFGDDPSDGSEEGAVGGVVNTFEQWRIKLQRDLENISNDDSESDRASSVAQEVGEVTLRWKSFEEEKVELLQQLERSRLKEIVRLQEELRKREERLSLGRIRAEKQRHLILAQIENLKEAIPRAQEAAVQRQQNLKEDITQISVLIDNCRAEAELLDNLRSHQVENEFTGEVVREKKEVTEQLFLLQARQREELEALKREKYCEVDLGEVAGEREVAKIVAKVQVLEQELEGLEAEKKRKEARHKEMMVDLKAELEKAERQRVISKKEEDEDQFACPVCMELLMPPLRIFQCPEGHILCENCKENPSLVHCPQCRVRLETNCSRNRALEEVARTFFPRETTNV